MPTPSRFSLRRSIRLMLCALACGLTGCVSINDRLTIHPDGSGAVCLRIETNTSARPGDFRLPFAFEYVPARLCYPPLNREMAGRLFEGGAFAVENKKVPNGLELTATFKDLNAFLASPYAAAHGLILRLEEGKLNFQAGTGLSVYAAFAAADPENVTFAFLPQLPNLLALKGAFTYRFTVDFPAAPTAAGADVGGLTATWTFPSTRPGPAQAVGAVQPGENLALFLCQKLTANCPAAGLTFKPRFIPRVLAGNFAELTEGPGDAAPAPVDAAALQREAKFTPVEIRIHRTFLLASSENPENDLVLRGTLELPNRLAPSRWGETEVLTAIDDGGESLAVAGDDREFRFREFSRPRLKPKAPKTAVVRQSLTFNLRAPDRARRRLVQFKGVVALHYPGAPELVKLPQIATVADSDRNADPSEEVNHPALARLSLRLSSPLVMLQDPPGTVEIMFRLGSADDERNSAGSPVLDLQIYDANGRPCLAQPSFRDVGDDEMYDLRLTGVPPGPLSLALLLDAGGAVVRCPVEAANLPLVAPSNHQSATGAPEEDGE